MMKLLATVIMTSTLAFGTYGAIAATAEPAMMAKTSMGQIWVDAKGMALYTFDKDKGDKSMCNDQCAAVWPPLAAAADAAASGKWTIVVRDDGSKMWAYAGHPLYTFVKDTKPGEVTGDNVEGFHVAK